MVKVSFRATSLMAVTYSPSKRMAQGAAANYVYVLDGVQNERVEHGKDAKSASDDTVQSGIGVAGIQSGVRSAIAVVVHEAVAIGVVDSPSLAVLVALR